MAISSPEVALRLERRDRVAAEGELAVAAALRRLHMAAPVNAARLRRRLAF